MVVGKSAGYLSLILLLIIWTLLFVPARLYPSTWDANMYAISTLLAGLAGIAGVIAGWKHSKLWYISGTFGFLTCAVFVAGAAV